MAKGKNQHVVKRPDGWAVKGEGNSKATKMTRTQKLLKRRKTSPEIKSRIPKFMAWTERSGLATATETTRVLQRIKSKE